MSTYQPLQQYLSAQASQSVTLSYKQIEDLLGRRLPPTAYGENKRQWWANTETHSQALAWLRSKRRAKLDVNKHEVTFIRQSPPTPSPVQPGEDLPGLSPSALRMLEDIAEEHGVTTKAAAVLLLNDMASRRRAMTLDWFAGRSIHSDVSSATMVREDRDAR